MMYFASSPVTFSPVPINVVFVVFYLLIEKAFAVFGMFM